jgi:hypothetical protein
MSPLKGRLTIPPFALTILMMEYVCVTNAGFYRPDHDPPRSASRALIIVSNL